MLYPTMEQLVKIIGNRYLLVNVTARRARKIAQDALDNNYKLTEKPVTLAVNEIYACGGVPTTKPKRPEQKEKPEEPHVQEEPQAEKEPDEADEAPKQDEQGA